MLRRILLFFMSTILLASLAFAEEEKEKTEVEEAVDGFQQLLPRGKIAALVDPSFVSVDAAEIPDSAWVLGYEVGGEAYAYDLNLLNSHEVVNHVAGDLPIAAVW